MTRTWEPGTQYNHNDIVEYKGHNYKIIQPHRSQPDWTPDITPALWGKISDDHRHGSDHHQTQQQHQQHSFQQPQPPAYDSGKQEQGPRGSTARLTSEEYKKHWWDLSDERKNQLEIGGGLAVATALVAGGYSIYRYDEKDEEDKKADLFGLQKWLEESKARTALFHSKGPSGPANWILNQGRQIPEGAIEVGKENNWTLYICRAYQDGGIQPGKASDGFTKGAAIGYHMKETQHDTYEILVGDMRGLRWVETSGYLDVSSLGYQPVEGGHENEGTQLAIAKALYKDAWHPGKASKKLDGAYIPYGGEEINIKEYQVLCYYK